MPLDAQSLALSKLLAQASTQHLRLTLEPLPMGLIELDQQGIMVSVDESTAQKLGFMPAQLQGKSITMLLEDCDLPLFELIESRQYGALFKTIFRTRNGAHMLADVVLEPALQSHKFVCSIIFTIADVLAGEHEPLVLDTDDHLDSSTSHLGTAHLQNSSDYRSALMWLIVISLICFLFLLVVLIK